MGLEPSVIDVDAFALHNAFEINYPEAMRGVVGLVNIGHEITNINILDDGVPVLTRDIPVGTRRFREDLQRERGLSADEAERLLQGSEPSEALEPFLETRGEELAVGIERAAAFLQSASRSASGHRPDLYTTGGGARIPRPQQGAGGPAAPAGPAGQPDRAAAGGRRRLRHDAGRRSRAAADAADRPRAASAPRDPDQDRRPMITVNLRPDLKRKRARRPALQGAGRARQGAGQPRSRIPLLLGVVGLRWVGVLGWLGFVVLGNTRRARTRSTPQLEQARTENKRFKAFLAAEAAPGDHPRLAAGPDRRHPRRGSATATSGRTCSTK